MTDTDLELVARRALAARFPVPFDVAVLHPTARPAHRRPASVLAAVAAALVVLGVAAAFAIWPRSDNGAGVPGSLDAATRTRITRLVHTFEHDAGGGRVARVDVVRSTRQQAVQATMGGDIVPRNEPVWVVQLTAATVFHAITTGPPGANTNPIVKYAIWVLDARTLQNDDASIGNHATDLSVLGPVTSFKP